MPRLRNKATGVVVNVDEDTAARIGDGYEAADAPKKQAPKRKSEKPADDE